MSIRERRNRKDGRGKTWQQLKGWHCLICMRKIAHSEVRQGLIRGVAPFGMVHVSCPDWP